MINRGCPGGKGWSSMVLDNRHGAFRVPELEIPGSGHGALHGLTFTVKDVFAVAGHRSSAGNPDWLRSHGPADSHSAAVRRLLEAGATLRGRPIRMS